MSFDKPILPILPGSADRLSITLLQEWLVIRGYKPWRDDRNAPGIDGDYGDATKAAVAQFALVEGVPAYVDETFWAKLIAPMTRAFTYKPSANTLGGAVLQVAQAHLAARPREARAMVNGVLRGKDNSGAWVRRYCFGQEVPWCQGMASAIVRQAAAALGAPLPFALDNSLYVPYVVEQARKANRLLSSTAPLGSMFFLKGMIDGEPSHIHVGIVTGWRSSKFVTVEGNTNNDGSSNGWLAMERERSADSCNFGSI